MTSDYIPSVVRRRVAEVARYRCGYCLTSQQVIGPLLEIDHLVPRAKGGTSDEENLWLACPVCNGAKLDHTEGRDPETGETVPLFNPRLDEWAEHFEWIDNGARVKGQTLKGRVTVAILKMNQPDVVAVRQRWVLAGWHPPED